MTDQQSNAEAQNADSNPELENQHGAIIDAGTEDDNQAPGDQSNSAPKGQVEGDSATPPDTEQDKKVEISPEAQKIIAEKAYEERKARRELEEANKKLEELQKANAPGEPELPSIPDRWDYDNDDDYQKAIDSYADKKAELKAYQTQQTQLREQEEKKAQEEQQKRVAEINEKIVAYKDRATKAGIEQADLERAGDMIAAHGLKQEIALSILDDADGPLITRYLAANPQEIDNLNNSTWLTAAGTYEKVKQAATAVKPKTVSDAPAPADVLTGGATAEDENPWGATIE